MILKQNPTFSVNLQDDMLTVAESCSIRMQVISLCVVAASDASQDVWTHNDLKAKTDHH